MRIAITGGTGFVGRNLAARFDPADTVVVSRRTGVEIDDVDALAVALAGCDAVVHCAGINREIGDQTFQRVHVEGTRAVVEAARRAGVRRIVMLSFLRARPDCGVRLPRDEMGRGGTGAELRSRPHRPQIGHDLRSG